MRWTALPAAALLWAAGTAAADFTAPIFTTPIFTAPVLTSPSAPVPPGAVLAAPVVTPLGITKQGATAFEVVPAGAGGEPFLTRDPARYTTPGGPDNPFAATAGKTWWVSLEYLYWATQGPTAPPLVTTGPALLGPGVAGAVGQPSTAVLLGDQRVLNGLRPGFRVEGGLWRDDTGRQALTSRFYYVGSHSERLVGGSNGLNVVAVPQVFPVLGANVAVPMYVGFPGLARGTVAAAVQTRFFGTDTNLRHALRATDDFRLDLIGGYLFLQLGDSLRESFDVVPTPTPGTVFLPGLPGPRITGEDNIHTRNRFNGGQVGLLATKRNGRFVFEIQGTIALGGTSSLIEQDRTRTVGLGGIPGIGLGGPPVFPGQALTLPVRTAGSTDAGYFAVVPEFGMKLGWEPLPHLRLTAGYNFLYWSKVRRAEEVYALGPALRTDATTDFWAQGLTLGLDLRY